MKFPTRPV